MLVQRPTCLALANVADKNAPTLAWPSAGELWLNVSFSQRQLWGDTIHDAAYTLAVRFSERRDPKVVPKS